MTSSSSSSSSSSSFRVDIPKQIQYGATTNVTAESTSQTDKAIVDAWLARQTPVDETAPLSDADNALLLKFLNDDPTPPKAPAASDKLLAERAHTGYGAAEEVTNDMSYVQYRAAAAVSRSSSSLTFIPPRAPKVSLESSSQSSSSGDYKKLNLSERLSTNLFGPEKTEAVKSNIQPRSSKSAAELEAEAEARLSAWRNTARPSNTDGLPLPTEEEDAEVVEFYANETPRQPPVFAMSLVQPAHTGQYGSLRASNTFRYPPAFIPHDSTQTERLEEFIDGLALTPLELELLQRSARDVLRREERKEEKKEDFHAQRQYPQVPSNESHEEAESQVRAENLQVAMPVPSPSPTPSTSRKPLTSPLPLIVEKAVMASEITAELTKEFIEKKVERATVIGGLVKEYVQNSDTAQVVANMTKRTKKAVSSLPLFKKGVLLTSNNAAVLTQVRSSEVTPEELRAEASKATQPTDDLLLRICQSLHLIDKYSIYQQNN